MRDNEARGPIYRQVEVRPAYHEHHEESVVMVRASFEVPGLTQHTPMPLSIETAVKLHEQLGEVLRAAGVIESELAAFAAEVATADFLRPDPDKSWERKTADLIVRAKELTGAVSDG